jgi:hypothetical protein
MARPPPPATRGEETQLGLGKDQHQGLLPVLGSGLSVLCPHVSKQRSFHPPWSTLERQSSLLRTGGQEDCVLMPACTKS